MRTRLLLLLSGSSLQAFCQTFTSSNLPILVIDTRGGTILDDPKIVADLSIIDNGPGKRNSLTDKASFTSVMGIEYRGASSQQFPKKPYGIELRDSSGVNSVSKTLLGMPAESDWVLNATYNDKTLIRETLTYDFYRKMSKYYASRFRYCELMLNGEYRGIYIVMERLKRDKNRVPITSIKKTDITGDAVTGGYILKIDKTVGSSSRSWKSPYPSGPKNTYLDIQIDRPKPEDLAEEQFQYIKKYVSDFEGALAGPDFRDPAKGFRGFVDEQSFIDYLILTEVCKNVDGYRLSAYFYKERDSKGGKITMGPIWDYNLTYGNADYCEGNSYIGWAFNFSRVCPDDYFVLPFWWDRLLQDLDFARKVKEKYKTLRQTVLTPERLGAYVDSSATALTEARQRNFVKWPVIGVYVWPNGFVGRTYEAETDYLKTWIGQRLTWMDLNIESFGVLTALREEPAFTLGPNPSVGDVILKLPLPAPTDVSLLLTDTQGRPIQTRHWSVQPEGLFERTLPATDFNTGPGVYILTIRTQSGPTSKVIVRE